MSLNKIIISLSELIMLGDLNAKADATDTPDVVFWDTLGSLQYVEPCQLPPHDKGYTLDLVLTDVNSSMVSVTRGL